MSYILKSNKNEVNFKDSFMDIFIVPNSESKTVVEIRNGRTKDIKEEVTPVEEVKEDIKEEIVEEVKPVEEVVEDIKEEVKPVEVTVVKTANRVVKGIRGENESEEDFTRRIRLTSAVRYLRILYGYNVHTFKDVFGFSSVGVLQDYARGRSTISIELYGDIIKKVLSGDNECAKSYIQYAVLDLSVSEDDIKKLYTSLENVHGLLSSKNYVDNIKKVVMDTIAREAIESELKDDIDYPVNADPSRVKFYMSLKYIRRLIGINSYDLAKKMGISQTHVQRMESGKFIGTKRLYDKFRNFLLTCPQKPVRDALKYIVDNPKVTPEDLAKKIKSVNETYVTDYCVDDKHNKSTDVDKLKFMKVIDIYKEDHHA